MILYVTFGQRYRSEPHPTLGKVDPDGWIEIEADTYDEARDIAVNLTKTSAYTAAFAFCYDEKPEARYFPNGCFARFSAPRKSFDTMLEGMVDPRQAGE